MDDPNRDLTTLMLILGGTVGRRCALDLDRRLTATQIERWFDRSALVVWIGFISS